MAINGNGDALLHEATREENLTAVKDLIDSGIDVHVKNKNDETALYIAAFQISDTSDTKVEMMKLLITAGADVNTKERYGEGGSTLLHVAAELGDADLVRLLIDQGIDTSERDIIFNTPLHYAAKDLEHVNLELIEILAEKIDVNDINLHGETAMRCFISNQKQAVFKDIFKILLKHGAVVNNEINGNGWTFMGRAITRQNPYAVEALVHTGIDVNREVIPGSKKTILHVACVEPNLRIINFLLNNGANVNALDRRNNSPLHILIGRICFRYAYATSEFIKIMRCLLKRDPDVNCINKAGQNIIYELVRASEDVSDYAEVIFQHLAKLQANEKPLHQSLLEDISRKTEFEEYFKECQCELELTKITKLHPDSWITYFHLLVKDKNTLFEFAGNTDLIDSFKTSHCDEKFPIYGTVIFQRFIKIIKSRKTYVSAADELCDLTQITDDPNHPVIKKILKFLTLKDMKNLRKLSLEKSAYWNKTFELHKTSSENG